MLSCANPEDGVADRFEMCVRRSAIRHVSKKRTNGMTKLTTTTRLAAEFKGSPRYQKILAVFAAVDELEGGKVRYRGDVAHKSRHGRG